MTIPNAAAGFPTKPAAGWPVVIVQHGLRGNRTNAVALAVAYALQGFAVAAIDVPLHGITDTTSPFYQAANERTFNLNLVNNATGAPPADAAIDPSGTHIINLTSVLTSRDNLRQAAIDIVQLSRSLPGLDLDGDTSGDIDPARIHFAGISLGGIVGTVANALPGPVQSAYLSVPGGGIANLLRESVALSPTVNAGLAANGLVPGLTLYENFFRNAQTAIDSGDPLNYVAATFAARPIIVTQVVNDVVVPNTATQRLINAAPFVKASTAGPNGVAAGTGRWVHFLQGSHGSFMDPSNLAVTTEMQTHAASFVATGGSAFVIADPALLEP
jgi:alpha-beta hydrolase superfamily lysophospholipase